MVSARIASEIRSYILADPCPDAAGVLCAANVAKSSPPSLPNRALLLGGFIYARMPELDLPHLVPQLQLLVGVGGTAWAIRRGMARRLGLRPNGRSYGVLVPGCCRQ